MTYVPAAPVSVLPPTGPSTVTHMLAKGWPEDPVSTPEIEPGKRTVASMPPVTSSSATVTGSSA